MRIFLVRALSVWVMLHCMAMGADMANNVSLAAVKSPIIFRGDATTAYRDPTAVYHDGWFRLFFTLAKIEPDKMVYWYTAWSKSRDLLTWTEPRIFTPRDQTLNFCSPGNIVRFGDDYVLFHSPEPSGIGVKRSKDLKEWRDEGVLTLGQIEWPWAQGRLTAGFVLDLRKDPALRQALMFFHGSDFPKQVAGHPAPEQPDDLQHLQAGARCARRDRGLACPES